MTLAPTQATPSCGKCGYCVRGLQSLKCPECGSDLREVGINSGGGTSTTTRRLVRVALWTLVLPWPALLIFGLLSQFVLPEVHESHLQRVIFCQAPQLGTTITVKQDGRRLVWGGNKPNATVPLTTMTIQGTRLPGGVLHVELTTGGYAFTDAAGFTIAAPRGFDASVILQWWKSSGVITGDPLIRAAADDVMQCINEMSSTQKGFTQFQITSPTPDITAHPTWSYSMSYQPPATVVVMLGLLFVAWIAGIWVILRTTAPARSRAPVLAHA